MFGAGAGRGGGRGGVGCLSFLVIPFCVFMIDELWDGRRSVVVIVEMEMEVLIKSVVHYAAANLYLMIVVSGRHPTIISHAPTSA